MFIQVELIPGAIPEILASSSETGLITLADRYGLMAATLDESLCEEDRRCVDRLIRAVIKGRVKVTDSLSMIM